MFRSYFIIAWRNLIKSKGYSLINIGGLAIGMAVAILIGLWIYDELSYNKYHKNYDSIAQVMQKQSFNGEQSTQISLPRPLEFELRNKYGNNFKHIVMSFWEGDHILSVGDIKISSTGRFMQAGAPEMLSLKMIKGTWAGLKDPSSIMLSASVAKALFGDKDPMDKMMRINNRMDVKVTGVYEDLPYNTEFKNVKFLSSWDLWMANNDWMKNARDKWGNNSFLIYVQIQPNTTFESVSEKIKMSKQQNVDAEDKKFNYEIFLNPMSRWHLYSEWKNGVNVGGRIQFVWMFGLIGLFVLLLACINFMNLSTARSEKRAREVGVRKAIGSMRYQLISQFLSESFLVVVLAFVLAVIIVATSLSWFNELSDKRITMPLANPYFWLISLVFIIITSLLSGSYPALYLSSFNPVKVLKGTFRVGRFASLPRQILVVLQFTVSIALICGTIIVYRQIQHAKNRPVGYDRNSLLMIQIKSPDLAVKSTIINSELKNSGVAVEVAKSGSPLTGVWSNNGGFDWPDKDPNKVGEFATIWITHDYGKTVGWQIKEGRDFSKEFATDSIGPEPDSTIAYSIILNETAIKYMGLKNPVNTIIDWDGYPLKIVGVVKDIVMESPFQPVRQTIYLVNYSAADSWINIKINPNLSAGQALAKIDAIFKKLVPAVPFDYKFADTEYGLKFAAEERIGKLASVFAVLAIFISCLGLFGLASFIAEKRTKEIGIRKVLGATVYNLWKMLSVDFVVLVIISCCIAVPVAYYFLHGWLQKYEYRIEISWWIFVLAILSALLITLLTVSYQAIKAALANPVQSLRTE
ncbi:ABC transporter permease [Chitinophagaceae bacterium LB-8]|uniref:ABC transporter permease n=1 Tax=Paraflavisolibacter caeni TaxID=2982496 RepID=A0A9X3BFD1_9BACT|nr:ABC transporter permease [Paraflavisolibacter caeni]MCU7548574.1 ABC transporter permease [Paraflavisolibacter caeni]